jgi:class 3 adenylate cyclase/tetratricopeptide (TPR) repeat protein
VWDRETPGTSYRELSGTLVFADISGFTKLTERLAAQGRAGAEEMSDNLDVVLSELLNAAYVHGGWLVKWGGDALLLMYDGPGHAERACTASVLMRSRIREVGLLETSVGRVRLRMSIGVHSGDFSFHLTGTVHRELLITGDAATITAQLEGEAVAGEILISPQTAALLPARCIGAEKGDGILLARDPGADALDEGDQVGKAAGAHDSDVTGLLPELVCNHLIHGGGVGEHRQVVIAFLEYSGMARLEKEAGREGVNAALEHLVGVAMDACHHYQVSFHETDIGPDGGKFMLVAGAPQGLEEPAEAMLCALRQMFDDPGALTVRAGVTAGRAFTGCVGPVRRRSYSVKGDVVNLAARIMGKTPHGQIWALPVVVETSRTQFELSEVPRFPVKGKTGTVLVHQVGRPLARVDNNATDLPLIGRDDELTILRFALNNARQGHGSAVNVLGVMGIGKTRLIGELIDLAQDMTVLSVWAEPYRTSSPYAVVRNLFLDGLISETDSAAGQADLLTRWCDAYAPELRPWLPLLAPLLGVELPETPETRDLATQFRAERTRALILDLLRIRIPGPTLIVVDNMQFADDASIELLDLIRANIAELPWLLATSGRVDADADTAEVTTGRVLLEPMSPDESLVLIQADTDDTPLPPHVAEAVVARAEGNPLFLRQLARAAQGLSTGDELPDSVESVVTARIDRLRPTAREVLRAAAVVGPTIERDLLDELLEMGSTTVSALLPELDEFIEIIDGNLYFRQVVIRDAAYEGLAYRRRAALHGQVADLLAKRYGSEREDMDAVLSLHYFHAGNFTSALAMAQTAADRAASAYANTEAASLYRRALTAAAKGDDIDPAVRAALWESLGDVEVGLGEYASGERSYASAQRLLKGDVLAAARVSLKNARSSAVRSAFRLTFQRLRRISLLLEGNQSLEAADLRVEIVMRRAWTQASRGDYAGARECCLAVLGAVDEERCTALAADALGVLGIAELELGVSENDALAERALVLRQQLGDLSGLGRVHNMIGYRAYLEGRWDDAASAYAESQRMYGRIGDQVNLAVNMFNTAEILLDQGKVEEAEGYLHDAVRISKAAAPDDLAFGLALLGRAMTKKGCFDAADDFLEQARAICEAQGARADGVDTDAYRAEAILLRGDAPRALALATETLTAATRLSELPTQAPLLHRVMGAAYDELGETTASDNEFSTALALSRRRHADHEIAFTLAAMLDRDRTLGRALDLAVVAELNPLQRRLGIQPSGITPAPPAATPEVEVALATPTAAPLLVLPDQQGSAQPIPSQ